MNKDVAHLELRNSVEKLVESGASDEDIAKQLGLEIGTRYKKNTVKWFKQCLVAKRNQQKAFEKHGFALYSNAGKIAQKKHPWLGHELGKKYGAICGRKRAEQIFGSGKAKEYFSMIAKQLHEKNPLHSKRNMQKAHETMKQRGNFQEHQIAAALSCQRKHPIQLKEMSKRVHELYPDLAYRSRKKMLENSPYFYLDCKFDSNQEKEVCKLLVGNGLIDFPVEGKNVQFRIKNYQIDFFVKDKVFVEFHPPLNFSDKKETEETYFDERRKILDENGFGNYPLVVIPNIKKAEKMIKELKENFLQ